MDDATNTEDRDLTPADEAHAHALFGYARQVVMNAMTSGHIRTPKDMSLFGAYVAVLVGERLAFMSGEHPDSPAFARHEAGHLQIIGNTLLKQASDGLLRAAAPATETPQ